LGLLRSASKLSRNEGNLIEIYTSSYADNTPQDGNGYNRLLIRHVLKRSYTRPEKYYNDLGRF